MSESTGLVFRRNVVKSQENAAASLDNDKDGKDKEPEAEDVDSKETRLTLMEEVLLLGLKDKEVLAIFYYHLNITFMFNKIETQLNTCSILIC